jgi:hypothetical protein
MYHTLKRLAEDLSPQNVIHPGHNYAQTPVSNMQEQLEGNPFMHFDDIQAFVHYRMHEHDRHRHTPYQPEPRVKR